MSDEDRYDLVLGADIVNVDTSKGDITVTIPDVYMDDFFICDGEDYYIRNERDTIETHVENIELKKRLEELEREVEILQRRKRES